MTENCFQVLIKLIKPYTRINIKFISGELNIDPTDVESLLVSCILDSTINGRIDQASFRPGSTEAGLKKLQFIFKFVPNSITTCAIFSRKSF